MNDVSLYDDASAAACATSTSRKQSPRRRRPNTFSLDNRSDDITTSTTSNGEGGSTSNSLRNHHSVSPPIIVSMRKKHVFRKHRRICSATASMLVLLAISGFSLLVALVNVLGSASSSPNDLESQLMQQSHQQPLGRHSYDKKQAVTAKKKRKKVAKDTSRDRRAANAGYVKPIIIGVDATSLSVREKVTDSHRSMHVVSFASGMMQEIDANDANAHEEEQETHTIHAWSDPDPHATLPDGKIDVLQRQAAWEKQCVPMKPWRRSIRPTCNVVHEATADLIDLSPEMETSLLSKGGSWRMAWKVRPKSTFLEIEESGETRRAFLVDKFNTIPDLLPHEKKKNCTSLANLANSTFLNKTRTKNCLNTTNSTEIAEENEEIDDTDYGHSMVLKMLRIDRDYNEEAFRYNQGDIMAMDRFTASPFVVDAFAFCGMSVMTELAGGSGRNLIKRTDLEPKKRLRIARNLAIGLSQIHGDGGGKKNASLVHNDLNLNNLVLVKTSTLKYNDFNIAMRGRSNPETNGACGHPVLFESPLWRSPEEIRDDGSYVNEKIDIYAFGNILFQILTKHQPWTWLELEKPSIEEVAQKKMRGELPRIPEKYTNSSNMAEQALYIATMVCYAYDPQNRPSAWRLANSLSKAFKEFHDFKNRKRKELTFEELQNIFGL